MRHNPWNFATLRLVVVLTSAAIFAASLTQIAVVIDGSDRRIERLSFYGFELLVLGWLGVFDDYLNLMMWPLVVAVWVLACCKRPAATMIAALAAGALMWRFQDRSETPFNVAWLANPIIIVTWILHLRDARFAALVSAVMAVGLTLCFLWAKGITGPGPEGVNVADFETREIISYGIGYWLWVASAAILAAGAAAGNIGRQTSCPGL